MKLSKYLLVTIFLVPSYIKCNTNIKQVEKHFLSNFDWECESIHADQNGSFSSFLQNSIDQQKKLKEITKAKIAFGFLDSNNKDICSDILDITSWDDLSLFRNLKNKRAVTIAKSVDRAKTYLGKVTLYSILANLTDDIKILCKRQQIIKTIIENQELYNFLSNSFDSLKNYENLFFSFYTNDIFNNIVQGQYTTNQKINNSEIALGIKNMIDHQKRLALFVSKSIATILLPIYGVSKIFEKNQNIKFNQFSERLISSGDSLLGMVSMIEDPQIQGATSIFAALNCALSAKSDYEKICDNFKIIRCLQEKLFHVSRYIEIMFAIESKLKDFPELYKDLEIEEITKTKCAKIIELLSKDTFKETDNYLFNYGRVLRTFRLMHEVKNDFKQALCSLGKIEAFFSIANLFKEYENMSATYSFANYTSDNSPQIILKDFWNPLIDTCQVVCNSIEINNPAKNIVITGVNKGGKSTSLKAIAVNLILAQTFGITACSQAIITPFSKIGTYINIVDDIQVGNSLFESQQKRIFELLKFSEIPNNKFWFIALDEPFNGTNLLISQAILYAVAKKISSFDNNISIISTHFPLMGNLENESDKFCNYKFASYVDSNSKINCPFLMKRGLSDQNIAIDILKSQGFDKDILDEAIKIIKSQS